RPLGAADQPTKGTQPGRQVGRTIRRGLVGRRDGTRRITTSETNNERAAASATRSGGTGDPPPEAAPAEEGSARGSGTEGRSNGIDGERDPRAAPGVSGRFTPLPSRVETRGSGGRRTSICAGGLAPGRRLHLVGKARELLEAARSCPGRDGSAEQRGRRDDGATRNRARPPPGAHEPTMPGPGRYRYPPSGGSRSPQSGVPDASHDAFVRREGSRRPRRFASTTADTRLSTPSLRIALLRYSLTVWRP